MSVKENGARKTQNFVTICTEIKGKFWRIPKKDRLAARTRLEAEILDKIKSLGNPASAESRAALESTNCIHFASLHVVPGASIDEPSYVVLEMSIDGHPEDAIDALCRSFGSMLMQVYQLALNKPDKAINLKRVLHGDSIDLHLSFWPQFYKGNYRNGLPFCGTRGLDLTDIEDDSKVEEFIYDQIQDYLRGDSGGKNISTDRSSAVEIYGHVKKRLLDEPKMASVWQRVMNRAETPNFAEVSSSRWKSAWDSFRAVSVTIPKRFYLMLALLYLQAAVFISFIYHKKVNEDVDFSWNTVGYTGIPKFARKETSQCLPSSPNIEYCLMMEPTFLFHGLVWALMFALILSYAVKGIKKPGACLAFIAGSALYLTFPKYLNLAWLSPKEVSEKYSVSGIFDNLWHGLKRAENLVNGLLADFHVPPSTFAHILFFAAFAAAIIFAVWFVIKFIIKPVFVRGYTWIYFILSVFALGYLSYFLWGFYVQIHGENPSAIVLNRWHDPGYGKFRLAEMPEFIYIPLLLAGLLSISLFTVYQHTPIWLVRRFTAAKRKLPQFLQTLLTPFWTCTLVLAIFSIVFFYATFFEKNELWMLRADLNLASIFDVIGAAIALPALFALILMVIYFRVFKVVKIQSLSSRIKSWILATFLISIVINWQSVMSFRTVENIQSFLLAVPITLFLLLVIAGGAFWKFKRSLARNEQRYDNVYTDRAKLIFENESQGAVQNHMFSVQRLIPENFRRRITLPLMLNAIGSTLAGQKFRPGFLANVGTVHYARWVHLPRTNNYIFASNYDGSFESYLEDFIANSYQGTNLAWANCEGYPKITGLFAGGCQDGERFKRFARRSMQPTPFWYSAYPDRSAEEIRRNALIRDGLTKDGLSPSDAEAWLRLFRSIPRPENKLETDNIQGLLFGANGHLPYGACYAVRRQTAQDTNQYIGEDAAAGDQLAAWIKAVIPQVDFGDIKPEKGTKPAYLGFSAAGLALLGLNESLEDVTGENNPLDGIPPGGDKRDLRPRIFAQPFTSGMHDKSRRNILGDVNAQGKQVKYDWSDKDTLAILLIYSDKKITLENTLGANCEIYDLLAFEKVKDFKAWNDTAKNKTEYGTEIYKPGNINKDPFGFVDGISNPFLKGTKGAQSKDKSIHLVEPGEFILGYKDNHGNYPPSPQVKAKYDVEARLPSGTRETPQRYPYFKNASSEDFRDLGFNGSYLVIRELQQDVKAFEDDLKASASALLEETNTFFKDEIIPLAKTQAAVPEPLKKVYAGFIEHAKVEFHRLLDEQVSKKGNGFNSGFAKKITAAMPPLKTPMKGYDDYIKELMVGRKTDGRSLIQCPYKIDKQPGEPFKITEDCEDVKAGDDIDIDNEFLFGRDDPQGHKCPFGSHIRRVNPRDGLEPDAPNALDISNRHRILRRGRHYQNEKTQDTEAAQGTFFMCLNSDIDRQFEFVQQTWIGSPKFHGLRAEIDPIAGQTVNPGFMKSRTPSFTIQSPIGDIQIKGLQQYTKIKGGGYFFLPGKQALEFFGALRPSRM